MIVTDIAGRGVSGKRASIRKEESWGARKGNSATGNTSQIREDGYCYNEEGSFKESNGTLLYRNGIFSLDHH
jgi:hypothetical protein